MDMCSTKNKPTEAVDHEVRRLKRQGKRIVFTNGCFDLLHAGHVDLFRRAKTLGDVLVVAINSNASVRRIKGKGRPILDEKERAEIIGALEMVDHVFVFGEDTPLEAILKIRPDVLVKGADWFKDGIVGQSEVESWGGEVVGLELLDGYSTTGIIQRVLSRFRGKEGSQ